MASDALRQTESLGPAFQHVENCDAKKAWENRSETTAWVRKKNQ